MDKQNTFNRWYEKFYAAYRILQISTDIYLRSMNISSRIRGISLNIHGYASFSVLKTCFSGKCFVTLRSKLEKNLNLSSYGKIHQTRI